MSHATPPRNRHRTPADAARWSREPVYLAYLAIAVGSVWAYAWSDAVAASARPAPQRRLQRAALVAREAHRPTVVAVEDARPWGT